MSEWHTVACLLVLRDEFNFVAPRRQKGADGTIGDSAHTSASDHTPDEDSDILRSKDSDRENEVHALDIDADGPWPDGSGREAGGWFDRKVHAIIEFEKSRWLDPDDVCRLEYVIWRGYIYSRKNNFEPVKYTKADQHFDHAHFSVRYLTRAEDDTSPWYVIEITEDNEMDFWASAAKAARGDADATATDRNNRNNAVQVIRFALGLQVPDQKTENVPSGENGQLARIEKAVTDVGTATKALQAKVAMQGASKTSQ